MRGRMSTFKYGILPFAAILGLIVGLLVLEPHFSASIIIIAVGGVMMFLGGVRLGWFIGAGSAAAVGIGVLLMLFSRMHPAASTHGVTRFQARPTRGIRSCSRSIQSAQAVCSGLGLGMSRQKYLYLPEEHNDFIFSVVCEELGFIGAALILLLFALLILRGYWIALHCRDRFSFLVRCRHHNAAGDTGVPERRCRHESCAVHWHFASVFQLRRHGAAHPARRNGDHSERITGCHRKIKR